MERMEISRDGAHWGEMQIEEAAGQVCFHAVGALPKYGELLSVWGARAGAPPLLIGVAEPEGERLAVKKRMSRQYLRDVGYATLPERYIAGVSPPQPVPHRQSADAGLRAALQDEAVTVTEKQGILMLSCRFAPDCAFPLAFACSCCFVREETAALFWDEKRDCPMRTVPEAFAVI